MLVRCLIAVFVQSESGKSREVRLERADIWFYYFDIDHLDFLLTNTFGLKVNS